MLGIHQAFSIAVTSTFWIGIAGALIAAALILFIHEVPMRETFHIEEAPGRGGSPAALTGGADGSRRRVVAVAVAVAVARRTRPRRASSNAGALEGAPGFRIAE